MASAAATFAQQAHPLYDQRLVAQRAAAIQQEKAMALQQQQLQAQQEQQQQQLLAQQQQRQMQQLQPNASALAAYAAAQTAFLKSTGSSADAASSAAAAAAAPAQQQQLNADARAMQAASAAALAAALAVNTAASIQPQQQMMPMDYGMMDPSMANELAYNMAMAGAAQNMAVAGAPFEDPQGMIGGGDEMYGGGGMDGQPVYDESGAMSTESQPPPMTEEEVAEAEAEEIANVNHPHHEVILTGMIALPISSNSTFLTRYLDPDDANRIKCSLANNLLQLSHTTSEEVRAMLTGNDDAQLFVSQVEIECASNRTGQCVELVVDGLSATNSAKKAYILGPHTHNKHCTSIANTPFNIRVRNFVNASKIYKVEQIAAHAHINNNVVVYPTTLEAAGPAQIVIGFFRLRNPDQPEPNVGGSYVFDLGTYNQILDDFKASFDQTAMPTRASDFGISIRRFAFGEGDLPANSQRWVSADDTTNKVPTISFTVRAFIAH